MIAYYNPDDEDHRNWKEAFGFTDSDEIKDNRAVDYFGEKKIPTIELDIKACSFSEVIPEYINPVNGDELGEQTIHVNVEKHKGLYYFETKIEYDTWVSETLDSLAKPVKNPDANQTELPDSLIPEKPSWKDKDEINEA